MIDSAIHACPKCKGSLNLNAASSVTCTRCDGRYYCDGGILDFIGGPVGDCYDEAYFESRQYADIDPYLKQLFSATLSMVGTAPLRILDAGCGLGVYSAHLRSQGHEVYSVDASPVAARLSGGSRADVTDLPFHDRCFDAVISAHVLEHLTDHQIDRFLSESSRVLFRNGRLIMLMPNGSSVVRPLQGPRWFPDPTHINIQGTVSVVRLLRRKGYRDVRWMTPIPPLTQSRTRKGEPWLAPYFGIGERLRKCLWLQDLLFWLLSSTPLALVRDVMFISAAAPASNAPCR